MARTCHEATNGAPGSNDPPGFFDKIEEAPFAQQGDGRIQKAGVDRLSRRSHQTNREVEIE